jgi:hypothetical protein
MTTKYTVYIIMAFWRWHSALNYYITLFYQRSFLVLFVEVVVVGWRRFTLHNNEFGLASSERIVGRIAMLCIHHHRRKS